MFDTLAEAFGGRLIRLAPPPEVCVADPDHRWGLTSYHLVAGYRHWLLDQLLSLERPAPSVRGCAPLDRADRVPWLGRRGGAHKPAVAGAFDFRETLRLPRPSG
jgi:hypothetical protein